VLKRKRRARPRATRARSNAASLASVGNTTRNGLARHSPTTYPPRTTSPRRARCRPGCPPWNTLRISKSDASLHRPSVVAG
jgi:hypothetical protein